MMAKVLKTVKTADGLDVDLWDDGDVVVAIEGCGCEDPPVISIETLRELVEWWDYYLETGDDVSGI
jgi:hypothetical protein